MGCNPNMGHGGSENGSQHSDSNLSKFKFQVLSIPSWHYYCIIRISCSFISGLLHHKWIIASFKMAAKLQY